MVFAFSVRRESAQHGRRRRLLFRVRYLEWVTLSLIFLVYTASSIGSTFFVTAGTFRRAQRLRLRHQSRLSGLGGFRDDGPDWLIIASVVNLFLKKPDDLLAGPRRRRDRVTALTAYDTQKLKRYAAEASPGEQSKVALQAP